MSSNDDDPLFGNNDDDDNGDAAPAPAPAPAPSSSTNLMASLMGDGGGRGGLFGDDDDDDDDDNNNNNNTFMASKEGPSTNNNTSNGNSGGTNNLFGDDPPPFSYSNNNNTNNKNNNTPMTMSSAAEDPLPFANPSPPPVPSMAAMDPSPSSTPVPAPPAQQPTQTTSNLLAQSGLLGDTASSSNNNNGGPTTTTTISSASLFGGGGSGGGGGLFDEVDAAEQARQQQEAQAAAERQRQEQEAAAERQRREQEAAKQRQAQEELQRQQQQQQQQRQQQQQQQLVDQMQSVYLGPQPTSQQQSHGYGGQMAQSMPPQYVNTPTASPSRYGQQQQQQQFSQSQYGMSSSPSHQQQQHQPQPYGGSVISGAAPVQAGFYRDHGGPPNMNNMMSQQPQSPQNNNMMPPGNNPQMQQQQQQQRYYQPQQTPSVLAGMHNGPANMMSSLGRPPAAALNPTKPPSVPTFYQKCHVSEPLLIPGQALFGNAPHWSYQITTTLHPPPNNINNNNNNNVPPPTWLVRRRFRHVVALEERLREECPGAILPPRPDKHATRALEEASTQQSAEFAVQRATELQVYLNQLIVHPAVYGTHTLRLFLSLQDDLGTAWPEVSNNAFTRIANAGVGAAVKVSEQTQTTKFPWSDSVGFTSDEYGEEDAELMALMSAEAPRMAAVLQGVPKVEGAVTLLREGAELRGATGMELSRLSKEVENSDKELSYPMELVAGGMLRSGRRSKRMALELAAALETFVQQYKLCRYEKMAFGDRRVALMRRYKERGKADQRAHQLLIQQQRMSYGQQPYGGAYGNANQMQNQAVNADSLASDAVQECNEIGRRVKSEVNRIAWHRRQEWKAAVKVVASACKESVTENVAIWESVRESFLQAYPEE